MSTPDVAPSANPDRIGEPLYAKVAAGIKQSILSDGLSPGDRIEPEDVLALKYGVSRVTLRRAIELLIEEGLLLRRHGIGTFVTSPRLTDPLIGLHSTRDLFRAYGWKVEARIVDWEVVRPTATERARLQLLTDKKVVRFVRCDVVGRVPAGVVQAVVPSRFAGVVDRDSLSKASSYDLLDGVEGLRLSGAHQVLRAAGASETVAKHLRVRRGFPIFVLERTTFDASGVPVEWAVVSYRHDWVEFSIDLSRQPFGVSAMNNALAVHHPSGP